MEHERPHSIFKESWEDAVRSPGFISWTCYLSSCRLQRTSRTLGSMQSGRHYTRTRVEKPSEYSIQRRHTHPFPWRRRRPRERIAPGASSMQGSMGSNPRDQRQEAFLHCYLTTSLFALQPGRHYGAGGSKPSSPTIEESSVKVI
ncbi:hypothetical protein CSUI_011276 [Cystoisospora suis]|uniref:Uncharacterized protein n=1 Tax=Cystoisospora suis TaxID=483139 RepID=A0A2C6KEX0_9APIC|nr:hypothetical protein CSUI_011276 [Cystoisospora suis]